MNHVGSHIQRKIRIEAVNVHLRSTMERVVWLEHIDHGNHFNRQQVKLSRIITIRIVYLTDEAGTADDDWLNDGK